MLQLIQYKPPRIAMGLVVVATATNALLSLTLHASLAAAATVTAVLGFSLMIRAWWLFKQARTAICPTHAATFLVTDDVYAITRNPMYLGIFLMLTGLAMATGSAAFYVAAITYAVVMDRVFCVYEEQKSLHEFGDDYLDYARRVRRWI